MCLCLWGGGLYGGVGSKAVGRIYGSGMWREGVGQKVWEMRVGVRLWYVQCVGEVNKALCVCVGEGGGR